MFYFFYIKFRVNFRVNFVVFFIIFDLYFLIVYVYFLDKKSSIHAALMCIPAKILKYKKIG